MLSTLNKWSKHILMAIPLLIFAPMAYFASKPTLCAYVMLWMAMYWLSAVLPLPVTSMMPLVLFPLLDILSTEETASAYFDPAVRVHAGHRTAVDAVFQHRHHCHRSSRGRGADRTDEMPDQTQKAHELGDQSLTELRREMMVSVAYASSIGGTGALAGTPGNIIMKQLYEKCDKADHLKATEDKTRREVERRNQELGRIGCGELAVVLLLVLLVYLWLFKSRDSILGWMKLLPLDAKPGASTTLLMVVVPLFAIPRSRQRSARGNPMRPYDPILSWREMSSMCHWNLMFLVSGSLTFSKASRASGLSDVIMYWLDNLEGLDQTLVATILSLLAATVTEFFSNAAVVSMLIPIVLETAVKFRMHPMTLAMPVTLSCSFAFTLPASTPPNALVYDMASMGVRDMIWPGLHLTLICVSITVLLTSTLGRFVLDVGEFPEWASDNVTSPSQLTV
ncbi:hypothetical protein HPB49_017425 [Dermacentor silvarum]|uniref:Uncharacterized protein n=1 Tax=Dermacentor silvarum TaxID=543639 RepID=A0ACB8D6L2_DERSI|nr:hypothetical protein HPB49_017425 [Dermacentor silvarum]